MLCKQKLIFDAINIFTLKILKKKYSILFSQKYNYYVRDYVPPVRFDHEEHNSVSQMSNTRGLNGPVVARGSSSRLSVTQIYFESLSHRTSSLFGFC